MSDEKSQQQTSTESTVAGAAKTGKAISNIAKGAAAGGAHGAAIEAGKSSAKWLIPLVAAVLLPLILVAMLPAIIFGSLLGDGTDTPNGISSDEVLVQNMTAINESISSILSEGLTDVLERIDSDFASSGCDGKEINNPFGADVVFNANAFVSQYCAHKDTDIASISKEDMEALLTANKDKLYSFAFTDEEREISPEQGDEDSGEAIHETIRIYTISYNGEAYFADQVFHLSDDQKLLASQYAQNLTVLLGDGIYQGLSETEFSAMDLSYDGVVFADGETQVVYYNQLDERWKYSPYGTDTIGGYACGPTAMAIVISSLTSETIDPPHMAQWAYEHGYWCSGNGSYRSLIPGAAQAWSLSVDGCTASEPQRIIDALAEGKLVVALMTKGHFTSSGHFIVLRGCTSDGKILVADPSSYKRSEKSWDMSILYTVTYLGTKIEPTKAEPTFKGSVLVISIIGGTALLAALLFLVLTLRKNTTVYKATGKGNEYEKCGRLHLKVKNPELRIDRLKDIPEGVIAIEVDQAVAKKLFGQTIAIRCYDNTVEHTVGEVNGSYWFKVDIGSQEGESNYEEEP